MLGMLVIFFACHLDDPASPDSNVPTAELKGFLADGDTLLWKVDGILTYYPTMEAYSAVENIVLLDSIETYSIVLDVQDDGDLYKVNLYADINGNSMRLASLGLDNSGLVNLPFNVKNLSELNLGKGVFDINYSVEVYDKSEKSGKIDLPEFITAVLDHWGYFSLDIPTLYSTKIIDDALVTESVENPFVNQSEKLVFLQFHGNMCINCMAETKELQMLYESEEFDSEKCYIATVFSSPLTIDAFRTYIFNVLNGAAAMAGVKPTFDTYFDGIDEANDYDQDIKKYFGLIDNDVIAIYPDGSINKFTLGGDFEEWVHTTYTEFLNSK